ncbi:hypothetical protein LAZ40_05600 [Cereibacter sphaeroides]|uniref:hypothetical protein n=1 Tax=Cereibacter sphaeroides TaxID=1063 RepID=UPI001F2E890E|nr:hypothetical protein [Cereibacter sphaeroides]MCE6958524.1 hypothetical protein [Cereibacter sphaeroides]MCE6972814.1 hypothetical protein [Cereibacter sphaeroides]
MAFNTFSWEAWEEETDYSAFGVAHGDGSFVSTESEDPGVVQKAKAGAGGKLDRYTCEDQLEV